MHQISSSLRIWMVTAALSFAILGCALLREAVPSDQPRHTAPPAEQATPTNESLPSSDQPVDLDKIQVDYLYRSDLITIIYPLYG
ncbi:MAG: hypothetical protein N3D16_07805 [Anaerolineales bacterium]|nr:hypothetical protein [Anaerolineales bacterium]